jgi:ferredoxin--NADP+ reductase
VSADSVVAKHAVPLVDVELNKLTPKAPGTGRVVANRLCTAGRKASGWVRHVEIDVSGTPLAGACRAGQSFGVVPPGTDPAGKPHKVRLYSLASPTRGEDGQGGVISTCVKRLVDEHWENHALFCGVASNYICNLKVGDEVLVTGPSGKRFVLPKSPNDYNYLFFAAGTGVAPFRGMAIDLLEGGCTNPVWLISGAPYATDLLYHDLFLDLAQQHKNFTYHSAISREKQADGHDPMYVDGRIRTERDEIATLLYSRKTLIYICGLTGMELGIYRNIARVLSESAVAQYLEMDGETFSNLNNWDRKTIGTKVRKTERIFTETYD